MDYRIEQLRYLLREDPSSRIFYQLGELLRREGEATEAVEILRTGLERHPRYVSAWVCLGRSQRDLRALEEARQSFQTALDLDRENPVAARLLGETAVEREDWLGAVKALKLSRALTGADDELDARIAMVESRLDDDGRLDQQSGRPQPDTPPVRCLEVVNLSADDPFSASSEEAEVSQARGDVFQIAEDSAEAVTEEVSQDSGPPPLLDAAVDESVDEIPVSVIETFDETVPDEPLEIEDAVTVEISVSEPDEVEDEEPELVAAEAEIVGDPGKPTVEAAPIVYESSVGAWSMRMSAAGISGEEAWAELSGEIVADDAVPDDSWAEPSAAIAAVEAVTKEPLVAADVHDAVEMVIDEEQPREDDRAEIDAEIDAKIDDRPEDVEPEPVAEVEVLETTDDAVPQIENHEFDSIEATHPIVVEKRVADAEEQALAEADEQPVSDEARDDPEEAFDDGVLPGEDRGFDAIEVTRPIPIPGHPMAGEMTPEPTGSIEKQPPSAEAIGDDLPGDDIEITGRRHELEHGVPLPTMTLAKLALQQDDRPLAMATLESLIERDPTNTEAIVMLDELSAREETSANEKLRAMQATTKIAALQGWLDAVRLAAERRVQ